MKMIYESNETPVVDTCDVLVAGGGPAGIAAAVAAARHGAKTILIERYGYLGGMATGGLVLYVGDFYAEGVRCIGGIPQEIIARARSLGGMAGHHVDSELLKIAADKICIDSGVVLRLHSWVVDVVMQDDRVCGVITESKSGRQAIMSTICVDATGDGDVAAFAGAKFELHNMRIGTNFKVGEAGGLTPQGTDIYGCHMALGDTPHRNVHWVNDRGLSNRGDTETEGLEGSLSGIDVEDLTFAEIENRQRILAGITYYRNHMEGYANLALLAIAPQLGVRDSRRVRGMRLLGVDTVAYSETIGLTGMKLPNGEFLHVPFGALVPEKIDGLLMAGRCIDANDSVIHSIRVIPPCMMTGQAAGTAAALCEKDINPRCLSRFLLRDKLRQDGVILEI